jgi:hypothetical protein
VTKDEFAEALRELGLAHSSALTAQLLGVSNRQIWYYLAGHCKVAKSVAVIVRLLLLLDRTGCPPAAVGRRLEPGDPGSPVS